MGADAISPCHSETFGGISLGCYTATHRVWDLIKKPYTHSYADKFSAQLSDLKNDLLHQERCKRPNQDWFRG